MIKDAEEIEKIRAAALLADAALERVIGRGLAGRTERDVALDLETELRHMGAESVSFPPIVASGAHGALPHAVPRDVEIPQAVLVTIDWGAQLNGYASDCTRTYATGEILRRRPRRLRARAARAGGRPGRRAAGAHRQGGRRGRAGDHRRRRPRASTSGTGWATGWAWRSTRGRGCRAQGDTALAAGQVVTVEPGVYVPGALGVRIEDLVVVTEDGHDVLSTLPKDLTIVH